MKFETENELLIYLITHNIKNLINEIGEQVIWNDEEKNFSIDYLDFNSDDEWKEIILKDKSIVWAFDDMRACNYIVGFYDAINDCLFKFDGYRNGSAFGYYIPFEGELPSWMLQISKLLKD